MRDNDTVQNDGTEILRGTLSDMGVLTFRLFIAVIVVVSSPSGRRCRLWLIEVNVVVVVVVVVVVCRQLRSVAAAL